MVTATEACAPRVLLARFLIGEGIELGPGHQPLPLFPGASARYVDRWEPDENRRLFPELGHGAQFPEPHVVANLDTDKLSAFEDCSQDFVIASHVLEHVAEPLGQLAEIHRVLRPGGVALILLPDRRCTFDSKRPPTSLAHLISEHERRVTTVSDEHIEEFVWLTEEFPPRTDQIQQRCELPGPSRAGGVGSESAERAEVFDQLRKRSIHVHCWTQDEFLPVLEHTIAAMGMRWELLDTMRIEDFPSCIEFGLVLRKVTARTSVSVLCARLQTTWGQLAARSAAAVFAATADGAVMKELDAAAAQAPTAPEQRSNASLACEAALVQERERARALEDRLAQIQGAPAYAAARRVYRCQRHLRTVASAAIARRWRS